MNKSAQQENPNLLDEQTKILKIKFVDGIVLVNKLQQTNEAKIWKDLGNLFLQKLSFDCCMFSL